MDGGNPTTALLEKDTVDGVVDYRGKPVSRSNSGGWRSALFVMGGEVAERFAYYGIEANLINYLTGPFGKSIAEAAASVNVWAGFTCAFSLLGAFLGDSYLGRYRMVLLASFVYVAGAIMLMLSALLPSLHPPQCQDRETCSPPTQFQTYFLFASLYLVAIAQGGHKPNLQAFGADQFDAQDPKEGRSKSSFFNWLNFSVCFGSASSILIVTYIQDNKSWGLGFSLPCISLLVASALFFLGTPTYRYVPINKTQKSANEPGLQPLPVSSRYGDDDHDQRLGIRISPEEAARDVPKSAYKFEFVEVAKFLRLMPIWVTCIFYGIVDSQPTSLFNKQGVTMDRRIGPHFQVPAAALESSIAITTILFVPIYDRIFVPFMRPLTGLPSGITTLQRIGIGLLFSFASMAVAATVESRRLALAGELGLADDPLATVPMRVWWLLPQYVLYGAANVFVYIGSSEFFYDQMREGRRSLGIAFCLTAFGVGNFLSGILVSVIDRGSGAHGRSWFDPNLNRAHLDYFFWLIASLSAVGFVLFLYFSKSFVYKNKDRY
ncbi:hypothetical protein H6P81_015480 [Aristolochia fimbriata]|uniref:Uncharacterized protein n=1 Tax=Aristolochia fimbriata TaxID=158543 RepID=A0AAV7E5M5_ARIFI|nr:hypothetical protein H6P81_015480 [Aristolochia fimbriata]